MAASVVSFDVGRCDPEVVCPIFQCSGDTCSVTSCGDVTDLTRVPSNVPIKTLIKSSLLAPFVKLRFETGVDTATGIPDTAADDATEITTGNVSQPNNAEVCRAVIKSFQYGWGAVQAGNRCKIVIADELGTQFNAWFRRITNNVEAASNPKFGFYKMKVQWGWMAAGSETSSCPATVSVASGQCQSEAGFTNYSTAPQSLICSPPLWFLPDTITVNMQQNGKFLYEIEGVDLLQRSSEHASARVYTSDGIKDHFVTAVKKLAAESTPAFNVDFLQVNEATGSTEPLKFFVPPNTGFALFGVQVVPDPDVETLGPMMTYSGKEANPLAIINQWLGSVRAQTSNPDLPQGRGITMNYDSNYYNPSIDRVNGKPARHGRMIIWADAFPTGKNAKFNLDGRIKALYLVNGGSCSPVFGFTPSFKGNFVSAGLRAGGAGMTGSEGKTLKASAAASTVGSTMGRGLKIATAVFTALQDVMGKNADEYAMTNLSLHRRANVLYHSIEAELRVQGDPSIYYCTPFEGYGKCVALVVINPFTMTRLQGECPEWETISTGTCNDILTNRAWFIKGCDHQIKEGSYITTLKIMLMMPGVDFDATRSGSPLSATPLGGDPAATTLCDPVTNATNIPKQDTFTCTDRYPIGDIAVEDHIGEFCESVC